MTAYWDRQADELERTAMAHDRAGRAVAATVYRVAAVRCRSFVDDQPRWTHGPWNTPLTDPAMIEAAMESLQAVRSATIDSLIDCIGPLEHALSHPPKPPETP